MAPSSWPWPETRPRRTARFRADYDRTFRDLERELGHMACTRAVLEMDLQEADLRLDGLPRSGARPVSPRVVVSVLDSRRGPLRYPCDTYDWWQDNVRAISCSLEHLRGVDRHGVTRHGEQYAGWKALAGGSSEDTTLEQALAVLEPYADNGLRAALAKYSGLTSAIDRARWVGRIRSLVRSALRATHPDCGGSAEEFHRVQCARQALSDFTGEVV